MRNSECKGLSDYKNKSGVYLSLAAIFLSLMFVSQASAAIVINEIYGAGGNAGATYNQDYVELYNNGTANVDISGYSIQYNTATGTGNYSVCPITAADTVIEPGTYFLIAIGTASTTVGVALPTPDATPTCTPTVNISASGGKIALVNSTTPLVGGTCPPTGATIVDFVGYGPSTGASAVNCFETAPAAAAANNQSSIQRTPTGTDTNNNSADFVSGAPTPQASGTTAAGAMINGRITDSRGRGLQRVVVMMTGGALEEPIYATTSAFGFYRFEDVPAGNTYILTASSIRYTFEQSSIVINVSGDFAGADFVGQRRFSTVTDSIETVKQP